MDNEETIAYQEALDYLYRFVDYSLVRNFRYTPEKFDLKRMETLLEQVGNPHHKYAVVHVAGTKGKGSTAALIASGLRAAGYRVGFYSSPHLQDFTERFQVNGEQISHGELVELVDYLKPHIDQIEQVTWFEITTAIGFEWFARQKVDLAVVEVGLGGRLDATNVVNPLVSVITSLSMDHMSVLGDTLAKIAFEKAGIIKPGRPVVLSPQKEEAREVVAQVAAERGSALLQSGRDFHFKLLSHSLEGQEIEIWQEQDSHPVRVRIPLLGLHQAENAASAYAALQVVRQEGFEVSPDAIRAGFESVSWPGRFELLRQQPPLIVNSAHNHDSALRLRQAIDDYLPGLPVVLIFGASDDKDIAGMFDELLPRAREVITTQSIHPRAADAEKLAQLVRQKGVKARAVLPVEEALEAAVQSAGEDAVILVTGSIFVAAAVRDIWKHRTQPEPHRAD